MKKQAPYQFAQCGVTELGFAITEVGVGGPPRAIAVTQNDKHVYAVLGNDQVAVIEVATMSVSTTLATGAEPMGIAMHPTDPRAYVANFTDGTVSVFDTTTHTAVGAPIAITAGGVTVRPASVAVSSDGSKLFVYSNEWFSTGGAAWVDLATSAVTVVIPPAIFSSGIIGFAHERSPYGTAASTTDPNHYYAGHLKGPGIWSIDVATPAYASHGTVHTWGGAAPIPCALVTGPGDMLAVSTHKANGPAAEDAGIDIYRQSDLQPLLHIDVPSVSRHHQPGDPVPFEGWGRSVRPLALRPTCEELWYGNAGDGFVTGHVGIVSLSSHQLRTFAVQDCRGIAFTSDGKHAFLSDTTPQRVLHVAL